MAREKLTKKELLYIERMASVGIPKEDIALILGLTKRGMIYMQKIDAALQATVDQGRAKMGADLRQRLWQKIRDGDMRAIEFACKTQLGMRTHERLEISGPGGGPIRSQAQVVVIEPTREEIMEQIAATQARLVEACP